MDTFTQTSDGTLEIEIGGLTPGPGDPNPDDGYDQINVSGLATLGGTLSISLINNFTPALGDTFVFLTYGSVTGDFADFTGLDLGNGLTLRPVLVENNYLLEVAPQPTILWDGSTDGDGDGASWHDPLNWNLDRLPDAADDVLVDQPEDVTITLSTGTAQINSLTSTNGFTLSGGTFDVATFVRIDNDFTIGGGTLKNATVLSGWGGQEIKVTAGSTLDGVTLEADAVMTAGGSSYYHTLTLTVVNGLTLNGRLTMTRSGYWDAGALNFSGDQTLGGTGEILFSQSGNRRSGGQTNYVQPVDGGTLTIGPGIRIYGQEGVVGTASLPLVNQGTIDSDSGQTIFVRGSSVTNAGGALLASDGTLNVDNLTGNAGHASVSAGSHLDLDGTYTVDQDLPVPQATLTLRGDWTNPSVIDAADGTVTLQGTWSNAGTINAANTALTLQGAWNNPGTIAATDATVNLHGTFTQSDLGVFNRTGSNTVNINGTLENAGETLLLDAATTWRLNGGRINGGTVTGEVGNPLVISAGSTLDGVVLDADVAMTAAGSSYYYTLTLTVVNGLTLNGRLTMTRSGYWDAGALNFSGDQTLGGTGEILFSQSGNRRSGGQTNYVQPVDGGTLTIGPDIRIYGQEGVVGLGSLPLVNQGTIDSDSGQTIFVRGSSVTNADGTLQASGGVLNVSSLAPNNGRISARVGGTVNVIGNFVQEAGGTVSIAMKGTEAGDSGKVTIGGTATLGGSLEVTLVDAFEPALGDSFQVLTFTSRVGAFDTTSGLVLPNNLIFEIAYGATDVSLTAAEPQFPDLVVPSLSSPAQGQSGGVISVDWTVQNNGVAATPGSTWFDRIVLSANDIFADGDDIALADVPHTGALAPGESYPVSRIVGVPLDLEGLYRIFIKTDAVGEVDEFDQEGNNTALSPTVMSIARPDFADLRANNLVTPSTGVGGLLATITWRVENTGPNATGDGSPGSRVEHWNDRIVASANDIFGDGDDRVIATVEHLGVLDPGEGYDGVWTGPIPVALSGEYTVFVEVDADRVIYEYTDQEANVTAAPNLFEVLSKPVIDDGFEDGNLATNTAGIGTGWKSATYGGGGLEIESAFRFDGRNRGNWHLWEISSNENFDFMGGPTVVARFHSGNVAVTGDSPTYKGDTWPGIAKEDWRHQFAVVSANEPKSAGSGSPHNEAYFYANTEGGLYVDIAYERLVGERDLSVAGQIRAANKDKPGSNSSEAANGVFTPATFQFDSYDGQQELITTIVVSWDGWSVSFSEDITVSTRAAGVSVDGYTIRGDWSADSLADAVISDEFDNGAYLLAFGQNMEGGRGVGDVFHVSAIETQGDDPDLSVAVVNAPTTGKSGDTIDLEWTVLNDSQNPTPIDTWSDAVFLSVNDILGDADDILVQSVIHTGALASGESYTAATTATIPLDLAGSFLLVVKTDAAGGVPEFDEANNATRAAGEILIAAPDHSDLSVSSVTAPETMVGGLESTITWQVTNTGPSPTGNGTPGSAVDLWNDRIVASPNATFGDADDVQIAVAPHQGALNPGESYDGTFTGTIPTGLSGNYTVFVEVNADDAVYEYDDVEPSLARSDASKEFIPQPYADLALTSFEAPALANFLDTLNLRWTVENTSNAVADAPDVPWNDVVVLSENSVLGDSDDLQIVAQPHEGGLAIGGSYDVDIDVPFGPVALGSYQLFAIAAHGAVFEHVYEANNILGPFPIDFQGPDLQVDVAVTETAAQFGDPLQLTYRVLNNGPGAIAGSVTDRFSLSKDGTLTQAIFLSDHAARDGTADPLAAGESYTQAVSLTLPADASFEDGDYFIVIEIDAGGDQIEPDETNNGHAVPIALSQPPIPDLRVTTLEAPGEAQPGQTLTVRWNVENVGDKDAQGAWSDALFISPDGTASNAVHVSTVTHEGGLEVGGSYEVTRQVDFPDLADGAYRFFVVTDYNNVVYERLSEANNRRVATGDVAVTHPDLTPTQLDVPASAVSGADITIRWEDANIGTGAAFPDWVDRLYLSDDTVLDRSDRLLAQVDVTADMGPGQSVLLEQAVTIPIDASGANYVIVSTDATGQVRETGDEANNTASAPVQITLAPYADLVMSDVTFAPAEPFEGRPEIIADPAKVTVSWTVGNSGTGAGVTDTWIDAVIASTDPIPGNGDDRVLARFTHSGSLDTGQSYSRTETFLLPPAFGGRYQLFVVADADEEVFENGLESNNSASSPEPFDVMAIPYADLAVTDVQAPATASSGRSMTVQWTVENRGIGLTSQETWGDAVWLANDAQGQDRVFRLGTSSRIGHLAPGSSYTRSGTFTVPNGFVGSYYVVVITGGPFEFIYTGNNTFVSDSRVDITLTEPPDLTVTDVSVPETATEGMVIDVTWTVENMGQGGAEGFWFEAVTLRSVDTGAVIWLGEVQYATPLPAGLTYTRTEQFRLPGRVQGRYETVVTTNSRNTLYEHGQTGNNSLAGDVTMTLSVIPRPDLQVDNIIASTPVVAGSTMSVAFDVINQGAPTSAAVWTDRVYLSLDNKLSYDDTLVFSGINASALGTSELYRTTTPVFVVPKRLRGDMFVIVLTDATGAVDEWPNDNNNLRAQPLFVEAIPFADLVLSDVVGPQQAVEGSEIEVRYTVTNLGSGPTDRDRWSETVWLARDRNRPNPSHGDILLGRFTQDGALAVNAGYDRVVTVKLPGKVATGSYFITPWTDSYAEVLEDTLADNINPDDPNQIDNNNYKARPISVIGLPPPPPAPLPDLLLESLAVDAQAFGGGPFTVTWTTRNAGLGDRQGGWVDYILLSDQPLPDPFRPGWDTWALNPLGGYSQGGLHAGETRTTSVTFDLSPPVEGMFVTVVVDAHRRVAETDESNNVRGADTDVSIRPADLVISGVVTQPVSYSGERTTIQWTVTNVGDHEAWPGTAYWVDKVWLSPDPTFIADRAVVMGTVGHDNSDPLGPGESYTATLEAILPKGIGGDYYVYIAANEPHVANHASSTSSWPPSGGSNDLSRDRYYRKNAFESPYNNVNQAPLPVVYREPDLRVTDLSVPAAANAGQMVDVEFTVTNVGNRATREGMWYDRIFLSFDPTLDISDRWLGDYRRIGVLDINASYTVTLPARLPDSIEGEFYILAFADASQSFDTRVRSAIGVNQPGVGSAVYGNLVKEFQGEGNNITTAPLQVTQPQVPDLQVTAVTVPERVERGQSFDVAYTVTNFGGATPPTQREWIDLIYLSRDTSLDTMADRYLGVHRHEDGLAEDESYQVSRTFTMPTDLVGPWYVLVRTDAGRRVFEGDHENNNDRPSDPIIVELPPPADLVVTGIDVPTASRVGQPVHIQWTVANASDRSLLASWADTAYLSADATWDLGDRPLGRVPFVGNLLPGGSYTASLDAELPPVAPGQYRVIVRTDIFNQIFEDLNEANNRLASAGVIDIGVDALELGVPLDTTLSAGQQRMFQVTVPADQTLRVTLSSASKEATNELYLRHGDVPTSTVFDAAYQGALGADQIAVVPNTRPGEYFVLIRGFSVPEDDNPHGLYDLAVTNPDGEQAVVPYRFQVERAIEPEVTIGIGGPRAILAGDTGTFSVTLQGRSNLDAPYVFYRVGVPEMGPNPKIFGLPFVQFATNLRGTPESEELADVPWASLDSATNTTGHVSTSGYLLDQPALGFSGFSFNVATYPGLRELHDRAYVQLRNQLTALFPAFADLLTEDQASLAPWWNAVRDDFADRFPEYEGMMSATGYLEAFTKTLPVPKACLFPFIPFEFHVFAEATAMTHEEFMAHQRSEAERLRQAILVDENASSTLLVLAADAQVWGDLYIASIEQAGLLRPEGEAPPVREQAHLVSLLATLAGGILVGPAGSEIRTSGNLVEFFEQVRGWYGHDPDLLAPVEFYSLRKDACEGKDIYNLPVPALPDFEQADLGLSQPTHFETFRVYAPWIPFERRGGGLPPEFQIDFTTGGGLNALIQGGDGSTHPLDLSAYLEGGAESDRLASVTGPITGDSGGMVPMGHPLPYTIQFENPATASTHTAEIRVVTELDEDLDPHSFRLGDLEVGDIHVHIPQDRALFQGEFDFTEALGLVLRVSAGIDIDTRTATWLLEAIDPLTGELCRDPNKGLLPPNAELNQGAGFVSYTVRAKDDAATGAEVAAQARVLFNNAPPQDTLELIQVVDAVAPTTRLTVSQLSEQSDDYTVSWNVTDDVGGSGFRHVTIYVAVDGGDFRIWQRRVEASAGSEVFEGEAGHSYEFLALATDMAGNREPPTFGFTGPSDGSTVNLGAAPSRETTPPNFGIAPAPSPDPATNRLFLETEQGIPAAEPASRPPVFDVVLRPFVARSFATGIAQSNAGIGPMAIAEAPDDTIIISGGQKRSSLFRFDPEGGEATEPWVELEHPVFNLAFDDDGNLWATTGGGPLLQLDSETGAIVNSFGDGLTIALAIEPDTGLIYVSSGKGVEIFDPATQTFTHYSRDLDLRVGCLAFDDDGRLWATTWPDREQVIRFTERARAETILRFDSDIDSIAFGRAGTQLEGLLFVSHNTAPRLDTGEVTGGGSDLTMVDLATLRTIAVARGGSRGDVAVTTSDGRVLLSQSEQVDVLKPVIAPIVIATNPPPDAIVALPWPEVTVTFDTDMVAGDPDDPTSVINPANYVLAGDDTGPKPVLDARYDVDTRTLRLTFAALDAHGYELTVSGSVSSIDGQSMSQPHVTRFTAVSDLSALTDIEFVLARSDRGTDTVSYDVTITNIGPNDLLLPLILVLDPALGNMSAPQDTIGRAADGRWFLDLSGSLPADQRLEPGESTLGRTITIADGTTGVIVSHGEIHDATAVIVGSPDSELDRLASTYGLNVYPFLVTLPEDDGFRQLLVRLRDDHDITGADAGTIYVSSNEGVVTVTEGGRIQAVGSGEATVAVLHGPAEAHALVRVTTPRFGEVMIGEAGAIVQSTDGYAISVPPGGLSDETMVSVSGLVENELPLDVPADFAFVGAFDLDVGVERFAYPIQVTVPAGNLPAGESVYFFRYAEVPNAQGELEPSWILLDEGIVSNDGYIHTTSPPWPGLTTRGKVLVAESIPKVNTFKLKFNLPRALAQYGFFGVAGIMATLTSGAGQLGSPWRIVSTLDNRVANCGVYSLNAGFQQDLPKSVKEKIHLGATTAAINELIDLGCDIRTMNTLWQQGAPFQTYEVSLWFAKNIAPAFQQVVVYRQPGANVGTAIISAQPLSAIPNDPFIESVDFGIVDEEPFIELEGRDFLADPPAGAPPPNGSKISDLKIHFKQGSSDAIAKGQDVELLSQVGDKISIKVKVPKEVILGLSEIYIERPAPKNVSIGTNFTLSSVKSNSVRIYGSDSDLVFAGLYNGQVVAIEPPSSEQISDYNITVGGHVRELIDVKANDMAVPAIQTAVTSDRTRVYALVPGGVAVLDAMTLRQVDVNHLTPEMDIIKSPGGASSITVDPFNDLLYLAGSYKRIYVIDISPDSETFHKHVDTIVLKKESERDPKTPYTSEAWILHGMAVNADGRRLYVTEPRTMVYSGTKPWIDQSKPDETGRIVVVNIDPADKPKIAGSNPNQWREEIASFQAGMEPYKIVATDDPDKMLAISHVRGVTGIDGDLNTLEAMGLWALEVTNDAPESFDAHLGFIPLEHKTDWRISNFELDLHNAAGLAVTRDKGYAFVADYAYPFYSNPLSVRGAKIGIVKDPFGPNPSVVAVTTPIPFGFADSVALTADERLLYVSYRGVGDILVFDVNRLIEEINECLALPGQGLDELRNLRNAPIDVLDCGGNNATLPPLVRDGIHTGNLPTGLSVWTPGPLKIDSAPLGVIELIPPKFVPGIDSLDTIIRTRIDAVNGHVCTSGGDFTFVLNDRAKVSLYIDGDSSSGEPAQGVTNITDGQGPSNGVFQDVLLFPGKYRFILTASGKLSQPGRYSYTLVAVGDDGQVAKDTGWIDHDVEINSNLPLAHTIIKGVDIWDGHLIRTSQDVIVPGRGMSLDFTRTYSSLGSSSDSPMGAGWTFSYDVRLIAHSCGGLTVIGGEGTGNRFDGGGQSNAAKAALFGLPATAKFYDPQIGYHSTLVQPDPQSDPNSYDFYTKSHVRYHFELQPPSNPNSASSDKIYTLRFIEEPNGNRINLYYDTNDPAVKNLPGLLLPYVDSDPDTLDLIEESSGRALSWTTRQYSTRTRIRIVGKRTIRRTLPISSAGRGSRA